jgi:hypothetical protein
VATGWDGKSVDGQHLVARLLHAHALEGDGRRDGRRWPSFRFVRAKGVLLVGGGLFGTERL